MKIFSSFKKSKIVLFILSFIILVQSYINLVSAKPYIQIPCKNDSKASAIFFYNVDKDLVLYDKNSDKSIDPASAVKLMTAIVAFEKIKNINQKITLTEEMIGNFDNNLMKLKAGEIISIKDLFIGMICCGYNDAANALAVISCNSTDNFVKSMNEKCVELGASGTIYGDHTGIGNNSKTTAYDTMLIAKEFMKNEVLLNFSSLPSYVVSGTNLSDERILHNRNALICNYTGTKYLNSFAKGMNFGMTGTGGYSLVTCAEKEGIHYICIVLDGEYDNKTKNIYSYIIANELLNFVKFNIGYQNIISKSEVIGNIPVNGGDIKTPNADISVNTDIKSYLPNNYKDSGDFKCTYIYYKNELVAPVKKGTVVGKLVVSYGDEIINAEDIIVSDDVERDNFMFLLFKTKSIFNSRFFIASSTFLVIAVTVCMIANSKIYRNIKRKRKRKKSYIK